MRTLFRTLPVFGLMALFVGCERPGPVDVPLPATAAGSHANADSHGGGKPELDPTYVDGKVVYMVGPHLIVNARETQPNLYAHAPELYLLVYPQQDVPTIDSPPITLPSGYEPQCDPCFHPGLPAPFVFHDHVITGAPGMGNDGTAGEMKAPWKLILLVYNPAYASSPHFTLSMFNPTNSELRIPQPYNSSKIIRSRSGHAEASPSSESPPLLR